MKRFFVVLLLFSLILTAVYPQDENDETLKQIYKIEQQRQIKNVFAININYFLTAYKIGDGFGLGIWYERYLNKFLSFVIDTGGLYFTNNNIECGIYDLALHGRLYPIGTSPMKYFIGASGEYSFIDIGYKNNHLKGHLATIAPEIGYKFLFLSCISLEIFFGYYFRFGEINYPSGFTGENFLHVENGITYGILVGDIKFR
jgi:hypothetical protein